MSNVSESDVSVAAAPRTEQGDCVSNGQRPCLAWNEGIRPREQGRDRKSQTRGWQILRSVWTLAGLKSRLSLVLVGAARSRWARNEETP